MRVSIHRNAGTEAKVPLASEAARVTVSNRGLQATLQRSLRVGRAGDRFEQEADAAAERVMAMPAQEVTGAAPELVQRCPGGCPGEEELRRQPQEEEEEEELLQASGESPARVVDPVTGGAIVAARSGGAPLPASEQRFFEPRFRRSFAGVRVHADDQANRLARRVSARAFTVGRDVFFGAGEWRPGTSPGRRLLAHELTHVVQQESSAPTLQRKPTGDRVVYTGGQTGTIKVISGGLQTYAATAYSGHVPPKGHAPYGEHVRGEGPIPKGTYAIRPQKTNSTITDFQRGTCGANAISRGYQEIKVNKFRHCELDWAYCEKGRCIHRSTGASANCWNPASCWGKRRIKIEGSARVGKPGGGTTRRGGFYIHGGNPAWEASSGCIKVLDDRVFDHIRALNGTVDVVVGDPVTYPAFIGPMPF